MAEWTRKELLEALAATAEVQPTAIVDQRIRRLLRSERVERGPVLRPVTALGLAVASLTAMAAALAAALAESGAAEHGVFAAGAVVLTYLALSSTTALPILLSRRMRMTPTER